jgi:prolyl 4-hydroxylase
MSASVFTLADFLSADDCRALVQDAEQRGFEPAPITTGFGFVMAPEVRSNTRVIVDDVQLAARLWARFCELTTPERMRGWRPIGLNERFRFYRYTSGQAFRWHRDGSFMRNATEQSLLTFMIYLNDGFGGGATEFEESRVVPRTGHALIFDHRLRHQGAPVSHGTKYVLRSDIMFERND